MSQKWQKKDTGPSSAKKATNYNVYLPNPLALEYTDYILAEEEAPHHHHQTSVLIWH